MRAFLRAAIVGAALVQAACAAETADTTAVTVYKSPT